MSFQGKIDFLLLIKFFFFFLTANNKVSVYLSHVQIFGTILGPVAKKG